MRPKAKAELLRTWEEKVKFFFREKDSTGDEEDYEVSVHGLEDNEDLSIEDGFHKMTQ